MTGSTITQDSKEQGGDRQADAPKVLRETDDEARRLARTLMRGARHMALAVIDPETGFPSVSRTLTGTDYRGLPVILISALSGHTKGLVADPRASLLAGEPGKGDPLAHPRITLQCKAVKIPVGSLEHNDIRVRFLSRHPKAQLYVDFPDFAFWRLTPERASLNGGFGRAYALTGDDLTIAGEIDWNIWQNLARSLEDETDLAEAFATTIKSGSRDKTVSTDATATDTASSSGWRFTGIDPAGVDLTNGNFQLRHEFPIQAATPSWAKDYISKTAKIM
jgi:putative heme iron utilization protein